MPDMDSIKVADLIHFVGLFQRMNGFHDALREHSLSINDWGELMGYLQKPSTPRS